MPRYIDVETALKIIDNYAKTVTADGKVVVDAIRDIVGVITPTADVVPKSEVASEIFAEIETLIDGKFSINHGVVLMSKEDFSELKKKYTEGEG